jgi:PilZ domain/SPOR domain
MIGTERRLTRRAEWIADIVFEPDNSGIVLNVSDGGLCFHFIDSVQLNGILEFSLSVHNQRFQAAGEVVWIDNAGRTGGLRFTALPAEIREEIQRLISQPVEPIAVSATPSLFPSVRSFPILGLGAETKFDVATPARATVVAQKLPARTPLRGFSAGLAVGLIVSTLITGALLFPSYRGGFGNSIIRFGERVAARPKLTAETGPPPTSNVSSSPQLISSGLASTSVARAESVVRQTIESPETLGNAHTTRTQLSPITRIATRASVPKVPPSTSPTWPAPPPLSFSTTSIAFNSYLIPSKLGPAPPLSPINSSNIDTEPAERENVAAISAMYFEIGRFKDEDAVNGVTAKLNQLGFPTSVAQKGRLWTTFYYVLVGPYTSDREAKGAHKDLVSQGFKPRPFERGSRYFTLSSGLMISGKRMPTGDCTIRWESYSSDVIVQFLQDNALIATVNGKWVKREERYNRGAIAYTKNQNGSRNLLEIRFVGMNRALVF